MIEVLFLALALSADAFAVSTSLGAKNRVFIGKLALMAGAYFGVAQGLMPLVGYGVGKSLLGMLASSAPYLAGVILLVLGAKMLYEVFKGGEADGALQWVSHKTLFLLAIATSIDALAAGFTFNLLAVDVLSASVLIAVFTGVASFFGALFWG